MMQVRTQEQEIVLNFAVALGKVRPGIEVVVEHQRVDRVLSAARTSRRTIPECIAVPPTASDDGGTDFGADVDAAITAHRESPGRSFGTKLLTESARRTECVSRFRICCLEQTAGYFVAGPAGFGVLLKNTKVPCIAAVAMSGMPSPFRSCATKWEPTPDRLWISSGTHSTPPGALALRNAL